MKAITVTYRGPTDTRGSKYIARAEGVKSLSLPYDYALGPEESARAAAMALCRREGWLGTLTEGCLPDGSTRVYTWATSDTTFEVFAQTTAATKALEEWRYEGEP